MKSAGRITTLSFAILFLSCSSKLSISADSAGRSIFQFQGRYLGFTPTYLSPVQVGEIEVIIKKNIITVRAATTMNVVEGEFKTADFIPINFAELNIIIQRTSPFYGRITGFKDKDTGYPKFLFVDKTEGEEFGLFIITGGPSDKIAPTSLFNPTQVKNGLFKKKIKEAEKKFGKGVIPTLFELEDK